MESLSQPAQPQVPKTEPKVVVMPEEFLSGQHKTVVKAAEPSFSKPKSKGRKRLVIALASAVVFIGLVSIGIVYFLYSNREAPKTSVSRQEQTPAPQESPTQDLSPDVYEAQVKDAFARALGDAKLIIEKGSLSTEAKVVLMGLDGQSAQNIGISGLDRVVGGIFNITPQGVKLSKVAKLEIRYAQETGTSSLRVGYFSLGVWNYLAGEVNIIDKKATAELTEIPQGSVAIIKVLPDLTGISTTTDDSEQALTTPPPSSKDSDTDGLTDAEELLYGTAPSKADSDDDSYSDGIELTNLYNPLARDSSRLSTSGIVNVYSDPVFNYQIFYPSSWLVRSLDQTHKEVMFTSKTGEFIEVLITENLEKLDLEAWLLRQSPELKVSNLKKTKLPTHDVIWSQDELTAYFAVNQYIYVITYNIADFNEANFKATLEMMLRSFISPQ